MRSLLLRLLSILMFLQAMSCKNSNTDNTGKTVFRYNESAGITSLDPAFAKDQANIWAVNQIFKGLVQLDDSLIVRPCIAKEWTISDGGILYRFLLRGDVYFHDNDAFPAGKGRRVVASDFVYSLTRLRSDKTASPGAWVLNQVVDGENAFVAPNDTVFEIRLKEAFTPFIGLLSMQYCSVVPKEVVEKLGTEFGRHPIGSGPFQFKYWKEGVKMVLLKNERYFEVQGKDRLPFVDAVAITFIGDKQTAFLEFAKGNLDFISGIDAGYKDELLTPSGKLNPKYLSKVNILRCAYLNTEYLGILSDEKSEVVSGSPLRNVLIRQAINYGFDRKKMMRFLRNNVGIPAIWGMVPPGLPGFDSLRNYGYPYNPEKSRELLAKAGYPNGNGLPVITLSTTASYLDICKFMQHQLSEIGIQLEVDVNPPGTLREMIANSKVAFFRGSWIADYPDAENYLSLFYSKNFTPHGPNYTLFHDQVFDVLYKKSLTEQNELIRRKYYLQMDSIVMANSPVIPLYYDEVIRFVQKNVSQLGVNPLNLLDLKRVRKK